MATSLKSLELLPFELQDMILSEISSCTGEENIEIDGKLYSVHKKGSVLLDSLILQLERLQNEISEYQG